MEKTQENAIGVAIVATIKEDGIVVPIDAATTRQLIFRKPSGSTITKDGSFVTDGTDGKIQYTTEAGFLDQSGAWDVQGYVVFPGGFDGRSDTVRFYVNRNL